MDIENLKRDPHGVFVIYEWEWVDGVPSDLQVTSGNRFDCLYSSASSHRSSSPHPSTDITHVIIFKCIGAVRDKKQQEALEKAIQNGESVQLNLSRQILMIPKLSVLNVKLEESGVG